MDPQYVAFQQAIIDTLRNPRYIDVLNFQLLSGNSSPDIHIYPNAYRGVAAAIEQGRINFDYVDAFDDPDQLAAYDTVTNQFVFLRSSVLNMDIGRSAVIHEATHAAIDRAGIGIHSRYLDESAAYIAEAAVILHLEGRRRNTGRIRAEAQRQARQLVIRHPRFQFTHDQLIPLIRAIEGNSLYAPTDDPVSRIYLSDTFDSNRWWDEKLGRRQQ
ncbi:hypothetical protein [Spirosoma endbachense]|uniref:Uncharacterized protein n=1 Tax=Spirosoma endbachense TaxID=2666025 RepID=A0A6P1VUI2_9BACT|nr:hypothetical protein [Spirosoma endbachense]QHV96284.1 hypothetical protein GJR95_15225 [Spirosoma endbachense]